MEEDGVAAYFRRLQVSHAREILLRTVRLLSPCGLSGSKLDAMGADDHGLWTSVDIRAEAGQRVARERSGSLAVGEDARCDDNGQVEAAAAGSPVWR